MKALANFGHQFNSKEKDLRRYVRLYFVREGSFTLEKNKGEDTSQVADGDYFGVDILRDQNKDGKKHSFSVLP